MKLTKSFKNDCRRIYEWQKAWNDHFDKYRSHQEIAFSKKCRRNCCLEDFEITNGNFSFSLYGEETFSKTAKQLKHLEPDYAESQPIAKAFVNQYFKQDYYIFYGADFETVWKRIEEYYEQKRNRRKA